MLLDATVVSLADEGLTYDQIVEDVKKELYAGKTYINLILAPDVDEETLDAIHIGLKDARDGSINLTLIGCKKIPSRGFMHFDNAEIHSPPRCYRNRGKCFFRLSRASKSSFRQSYKSIW